MIYKVKPVKGVCAVKYCTKDSKGRKLCSTHRVKLWRLADPVRAAYMNLKHNAKRRKKAFTITLADFRQWCVKFKYIGVGTGKTKDSFTVDRIRETEGYHLDNLQVLTNTNNVKKYLSYDYQTRTAVVTTSKNTDENLPF